MTTRTGAARSVSHLRPQARTTGTCTPTGATAPSVMVAKVSAMAGILKPFKALWDFIVMVITMIVTKQDME